MLCADRSCFIPGLHTFVSPSAFSRRAVVSYWRKYVHEVLVNRLGGLSLPRKSVVRLTDRPNMTFDVYRGRKTTIQQHTRARLFKLMMSSVNVSLKFQTPMSQICLYFLLKKCEKLLQCKSFFHFFNKKYKCIWL